MKKIKKILFIVISLLGCTINAYAGDHPEANFGVYGIQHQATVAGYQQYVGQVVKYLPTSQGTTGSYDDQNSWLKAGGKYNTEYVITKISGSDKRMTFVLTEKGTKNKVKMVVNNQYEYYTYGKYTYCITDRYSIPLFLSEKFENDKSNYLGKIYPTNTDSPVKLEVTDMVMQPVEWTVSNSNACYPKACYVLTDKADGKEIYYDAANINDLNDLGKTFTNPRFKCSYTVVNVFKKMDYDARYNKVLQKFYTVKNSIDGNTKEVKAADAESGAFKYDDSGKFIAALTKVEKPSNSAVRYGKTTSVTEKDITKYSYEDNFIDILIFAGNSQFNFMLKNVSENTLKVVWNEAVFVDVDGSASKIMHSGIKYSQREGDQPSSTIIKGAKLEDLAAPTDKVYYSDVLKEWSSKSLYSNADQKAEGQTIKLMLPIQVKDVVNEYIFEFTLSYVFNHPEYLAD